jgi:protein CpxP
MNRLLKTAMASVLFTALSASVALAQSTANPPAASHRMHAKQSAFTPAERVEARLAYDKTALKITNAQESQWNDYADYVRQTAQEMQKRFQSMRAAERGHGNRQRPNAIQRLERQQAFLSEASTRLNQRLAVEKPLYAALTPEQQKVADLVLSPRGHHRRMHDRRGSRMG